MLPHKGSLHLLFRFPFPPWGINLYTTNHHYHHQGSIAIYFLNSLEIETPYYVKLEISKYVQSLFRHKRLNLEEIVYQSASKFAILVEIRKTQIENYFGLLIQILFVSPYNFIKHKHLIYKEWCLDTSWFYLCSFLFPVCMYFLEEDCKSELAKKSPIILK